jgi:hypothetical protein
LSVFYSFHIAPIDNIFRKAVLNFSNGCCVPYTCGIGLNKYGFYPCGNGASIDRVFGFDIGKKVLPKEDDELRDQMSILCQFCGGFCYHNKITLGIPEDKAYISPSWQEAFKKYKIKAPILSPY